MNRKPVVIEAMVRDAFGLLLEIRGQKEAGRLLNLAIAFLKLLLCDTKAQAPPLVISVQAVRIRET